VDEQRRSRLIVPFWDSSSLAAARTPLTQSQTCLHIIARFSVDGAAHLHRAETAHQAGDRFRL
jgi:hypothetical protein